MTAHDPNLARAHGGLLGWLGFGARPARDQPDPAASASANDRRGTVQQRQLAEVGAFLSAHKLPVTAQTLMVAWN